jgi:hypothetical protein
VYEAYAGSIGKIADDGLRHEILVTYSLLNILMLAFDRNNEYLDNVEKAQRAIVSPPEGLETLIKAVVASDADATLRNYGDVLRFIQNELDTHVKHLLRIAPEPSGRKRVGVAIAPQDLGRFTASPAIQVAFSAAYRIAPTTSLRVVSPRSRGLATA